MSSEWPLPYNVCTKTVEHLVFLFNCIIIIIIIVVNHSHCCRYYLFYKIMVTLVHRCIYIPIKGVSSLNMFLIFVFFFLIINFFFHSINQSVAPLMGIFSTVMNDSSSFKRSMDKCSKALIILRVNWLNWMN